MPVMYNLDTNLLERKIRSQISDLATKKILVRTCLNVTTDEQGDMMERTRYDESFPLIQTLAKQAKAVLITAHLGRPKAQEVQYSFAKIAKVLEQDLGKPVHFLTNLNQLKNIDTGVYFLENVRFFAGEDAKDTAERLTFAKELASSCDAFINDAFADYRESASSYDVTTLLPSYVGPVFAKEISELNKLRTSEKPFVAII
jgi:phosphoglycerate kinase